MKNEVIEIPKSCLNTVDYLTIDKDGDCPLCWDIEALSDLLPFLVTEADGKAEDYMRFVIGVGWVLRHLIDIRNEMQKGGEA